MASQQRQQQLEWRAAGLCVTCGSPAAPSKRKGSGGKSKFCLRHLKYQREWQRKRNGATRRNRGATSYKLQMGEKP